MCRERALSAIAPRSRAFGGSTDNGEPYRALDLTFQVDNLVAGVTLGEFGGREPDLATVEALG